jgi:hypothetical protein
MITSSVPIVGNASFLFFKNELYYVHVWKCHDEIPYRAIFNT